MMNAKKISRRNFIKLVGASGAAMGLAACGSQGQSSGAASAAVPPVTIWGSGGQEVRDALQAIADAHNADPDYNTKARVEVQFVVSGTSEQSLADGLAAAYQAGETETDFDIIALDDSAISGILAQTSADFFIPIDTSRIPNYQNLLFKDNIVGDTFVPYRGTCVMLAYNSETVPNPPKTPEQLYQWIRENPGRFTYCDPSTGGSGYTFVTTAIYNQLPDEARMSPDTKWETEHTAEWDNAFDLMAELHPYLYQTAGKVQYPMKNAGSLDLLATKQVDMTPAFVNMVLSQKNIGTMPECIKLQQLEPGFSGALAGFCIPTIAKDKEAALSVIDYYLSGKAQAIDWNVMYASPVISADLLEDVDHAEWMAETDMDNLRYFAIGAMQMDSVVRWVTEIAPLAQ